MYASKANLNKPSTYALLPKFFAGGSTSQSWQSAGQPSNAPRVDGNGKTMPRNVTVHPGFVGKGRENVIIRWRSPINGKVKLKGYIQDADTTGSYCDGVDWSVRKGSSFLHTGMIFKAGKASFSSASLSVKNGDAIYFVVGPRAHYYFDSTHVQIKLEKL